MTSAIAITPCKGFERAAYVRDIVGCVMKLPGSVKIDFGKWRRLSERTLDAKRSIMEYPLWKSKKNEFFFVFASVRSSKIGTAVASDPARFRFDYRDRDDDG